MHGNIFEKYGTLGGGSKSNTSEWWLHEFYI
jgi:hypothetical protein